MASVQRTFAVIKPIFLPYRLSIETQLSEAGFDIIKERQVQFHPDDENLVELFGEDAHILKTGPVWVYVLEKENAVSDLLTLAGPEDPAVAKEQAPTSIRARYGESVEDNVLHVAPDEEMAQIQIDSIFVSSPPFPPANPDDDLFEPGESISILTDTGLHNRERTDSFDEFQEDGLAGGKALFRARPVPATTAVPSIQPRMSRAAALRAGLEVKVSAVGPREPLSKEEMARTFANVPGHKRASTIAVASTAPPSIAPRATRASLLRTGQPGVTSPPRRPRTSGAIQQDPNTAFPGYKRNLKLVVASTAPPAVAPRQTRASILRTSKDQNAAPGSSSGGSAKPRPSSSFAPPTTKRAAPVVRPKTANTFVGVPGHKRAESIPVASVKPPAAPPRLNRSATLRARKSSSEGPASPGAVTATSSASPTTGADSNEGRKRSASNATSNATTSHRPPSRSNPNTNPTTTITKRPAPRAHTASAVPPSSYRGPAHSSSDDDNASQVRSESRRGRSESRQSNISTSRPPSIEPKTNRAALLRAQAGTPTEGHRIPKALWV